LIVDAVYESIRPYVKTGEAILVCYGVCIDGRKILLHMSLGNRESYDVWKEFYRNMVKRGLNTPIAITSDGAPGLIKAIDDIFPKSLRLRCWVHKMRNLEGKVPAHIWWLVKSEIAAIRDSASYTDGKNLFNEIVSKYQRIYPSLISCLKDDEEALLNLLKLPFRHRVFIRSTNLVERMFVEERRRTKIIPQFLTEKSCLKLVFSVLYRASQRWKRMCMGKSEINDLIVLSKTHSIKLPTLVLMEKNARIMTSPAQRKNRIFAEVG
jgi:transposase-like protein